MGQQPVGFVPDGFVPDASTSGLLTPGNIDLYNRPKVKNPGGGTSTVFSASFNIDGKEVLLPLSDDGRILSEDQAVDKYKKTGKHLGIFASPSAATGYAKQLHNDYEAGKYEATKAQQVRDPAYTSKVDPRSEFSGSPFFVGDRSQPPKIGAPTGNEPVTLGDVMDDPVSAIKRIGVVVGKELTDPRTWLTVASMYFAPKAFSAVGPTIARAAASASKGAASGAIRGTAAIGDVVSPDIIGIISPRAGKVVDAAQRLRGAMPARPGASVPSAPMEPVAQAPAPLQTSATAPARHTGSALPDQRALNEAALAARRAEYQARSAQSQPAPQAAPSLLKLSMTADESALYQQLRQAGRSDADIWQAIQAARAFQQKYATPSRADVSAAVKDRNASGQWQE